MNLSFACPNCAKRYDVKQDLAGKRVKCSGCGHVFRAPSAGTQSTGRAAPAPSHSTVSSLRDVVPLTDELDKVSAAPTPFPPKRPSRPKRARAARASRQARGRSIGDRGERSEAWLRVAGSIILFGLISLILPFFGLQFRKVARLGDDAWKGGVGLVILGVLMMGIVVFRREVGLVLKFAVRAALVSLGLFVGLLVLGLILIRAGLIDTRLHVPGRLPHAGPPKLGVHAVAGGPPPHDPRGPGAAPPRPKPPPWADGPGSPEEQLDRLRARFRADRVVRLQLTGTTGLVIQSSLSRRLASLCDPGSEWSVRTSSSADQVKVILAPVSDLEALAARIDFGTVTEIDREERLIIVAVDRSKFHEP